MSHRTIITSVILFLLFATSVAHAQQTVRYDLSQLLRENKLDTSDAKQTKTLAGAEKGISTMGMVWLKDKSFKEGTIEVDLRGKDIFLKSFLGIAFHAKDTSAYEAIYFRPFRFHSTDTPTRKWSIQYMSLPVYDYVKLRKETPGVYENEVNPVPGAEDWFHATIVIKGKWITVYVNHSSTPSLKVKKLNDLSKGKIGLWTSGLSEDFANLSISK